MTAHDRAALQAHYPHLFRCSCGAEIRTRPLPDPGEREAAWANHVIEVLGGEHASGAAEPRRNVEPGDTDPDAGLEGEDRGAAPASRLDADCEPAGRVGRARTGLTAPTRAALQAALTASEAEVDHWKAHAEEAGRGFAQICRDAARLSARNVELVAALTAAETRAETAEAEVARLREAVERLCDEAEYVVLAQDDPGLPPVKAVAEVDLRGVLGSEETT